ncbi:NAD(P)H-hydrate dehydratase [Hydrocarboniphaga sp.]|uniref:NAD(P)H-hydrate dehydratase n=1 Tax=Hydrocarboniphaga sp. TaxID=2033016 RepID=UPI0026104D3E|nr:NAD(P)H-hydrate dehydratase [Hydrocarboniphaga sp.]
MSEGREQNRNQRRLYSAAQVREIDRVAIDGRTDAGYALMQRAAAAAWRALCERKPDASRIDIVCGPGNNGGDGYEIATLAKHAGCEVRVWAIGEPAPGTEAALARAAWRLLGTVHPYAPGALVGASLIVDALYGTGLSRPPVHAAAAAIAEIRASGAWVLAVDVPSGLAADTGQPLGQAVRADLTVSFIGRKFGLYTGQGPEHAGERGFDDLGVVPDPGIASLAQLLDAGDLHAALPRRPRGAHKGSNGFALLIGGDTGFAGAILLAARAALRTGAGLVAVATRTEQAGTLAAAQPEAMFRGVADAGELKPLLEKAGVIAIGPGLGQNQWGRDLWQAVLQTDLPLVVDADALNLLAEAPSRRGNWVLTPHPGEAARLLGCDVKTIEADRLAATRALVARYGGCVILKGAGSLIGGREMAVCPYGNPGMASGGMGDTLTGIVAALLAQGLPLEDAARIGVLVHARAGDLAARGGERGLLPSDLIEALRDVVNP